jgi:hypothetical protein
MKYYTWTYECDYDDFLQTTVGAISNQDIMYIKNHYDHATGLMKGSMKVSYEYITNNNLWHIINLLYDVRGNKQLIQWAQQDSGKLQYLYETLVAKPWRHMLNQQFQETNQSVANFVSSLTNDPEFSVDLNQPCRVHPVVERYLNEMDWFVSED